MRHGSSLQKPAAGVKRHRAAVAVCSLAAKLTAINVAFFLRKSWTCANTVTRRTARKLASFAVIGCSVMAVKVCNTGKAASLSISIMLL
jgi:hypothetical protein